MEKKNIISLAGELASGKGAVSKLLCEVLNYTVYRNGEYVRKLAKEKGLDITSFNEYLKDHPEIDRQIEKSAAEYAKSHDYFIIDARLGWYAVPESFKVYLVVELPKGLFMMRHEKQLRNFQQFKSKKKILCVALKWKMKDILNFMVYIKKILRITI